VDGECRRVEFGFGMREEKRTKFQVLARIEDFTG
jgi:hypothetical protein